MKTAGKVIAALAITIILLNAGRMEYICDVIDSIPDDIYDKIISIKPKLSMDEIAEYYIDNRDSLHMEQIKEQEYEYEFSQYKSSHPNDFK